ncbi:4,5-DOPA dioxygenase extradiol [Dysgonomonas sp. ZJ279]|uniref:4,5-DOPA-extradiol-dioxygenase n=1 Tax=Dysgonomonas sp. ZJ279 TaxID=2709796 RepID=UPI0013EAEB11|nr:4,5-DOPA dioxygenase extradiol [Dysgonomonas sp. ZJ279]
MIDFQQILPLENTHSMPVLFVGHGSPMNAIENNLFTDEWIRLGKELPRPKAILCISAHWETGGTFVTAMEKPKTIHDFGGFPQELYAQQYPAEGLPLLGETIRREVKDIEIGVDYDWGLDHGSWSFLKHMYPEADIPVVELSIDFTKGLQYQYDLAKELRFLRQKGVLIIGSGNMVHNLRMLRIGEAGFNAEYGYDWAMELNQLFKEKILAGDHKSLIEYHKLSKSALLAIPSEEHYIPLLYALALQTENDEVKLFNDRVIAGSLSMTSLIIGN